MSEVAAFFGERVDVELSDAVDDALVVTVHPPADDPSIAVLRFEVSRAEAREIIQGTGGTAVSDVVDDLPELGGGRDGWQAAGACRGDDPDRWFPGRGEATAELKAVCAACPVRLECLEHALAVPERWGVWGGLSERERRRMRRQRARARRDAEMASLPVPVRRPVIDDPEVDGMVAMLERAHHRLDGRGVPAAAPSAGRARPLRSVKPSGSVNLAALTALSDLLTSAHAALDEREVSGAR